ncbi:MAG: F0F1 ATP synthase subunit gamma [Alphaproteobacteria bacterium]|nr:F0F1 ATP synthase subunit gamma [Alphaproteobacteria bacterium]
MASLKELRTRISSVKSTQRITSAMKMVAAAKLRRAQEDAEATRPYAERMERMLGSLAQSATAAGTAPPLMAGSGKDDVHLLVVMTTDRGLCGGFNGSIARWTRQHIHRLRGEGKEVKLLIVGRKGRSALRRDFSDIIIDTLEDTAKPSPKFETAAEIAQRARTMFEAGECDVCTIIYNKFVSALTQEVTPLQLIPFAPPPAGDTDDSDEGEALASGAVYDYEPDEQEILAELLPRNLSIQVFRAMNESFASEQGARMTAMDNATRNAGDMIERLSIEYNRTRQAAITTELIEIISGAEAL